MFRIQENVDGTTSIYDKNRGNLLCTIPSKANSSVPRRVNVVEPQPSNVKWQQLNGQRSFPTNEKPTDHHNDEKDDTPLTRESRCRLSPIPISLDGEQSEDYANDCIAQENFAKCLNLVPAERFRSVPLEKLQAEWPLRLLSRSQAYRTNEPLLKDLKIPDNLPLTSCLGVRLLRLNKGRHFAEGERAQVSLRAYESFCRHPYNTACPTSCHFPKLRCREKKQYPVVTASRVLRHHPYAHCYSRGRRQREERKVTLRMGLDAHSRRLLRICSARTCTVDVSRLPEQEIQDWLSRRSPPSDDSESEEEDSDPTYRPSRCLPSNLGTRRRDTRVATKPCAVYVRNVVMDIQRRHGSHYIRNTNMEVPFYRDFLASLRTNRPLLMSVYIANRIGPPVNQGFYRQMEDISLPSGKSLQGAKKSKSPECSETDSFRLKGLPLPPKSKPAKLVGLDSARLKELLSPERLGKCWQKRTAPKILCVRGSDSPSKHKGPFPPNKVGQGTQKQLKPMVLNLDTNSAKLKELMRQASGTSKGLQKKITAQPTSAMKKITAQPASAICTNKPEPIPVIDLTEETTPPRETPAFRTSSQGVVHRKQMAPNRPLKTSGPGHPSGHRQQVAPNRPLFVYRGGRPPSKNQAATKGVVQERFLVSQWKFRCFACGFQRVFFNSEHPQVVEGAVRDHMHSYHFVSDAESFLSRYLDSVNHCTVIEAFPGFKTGND